MDYAAAELWAGPHRWLAPGADTGHGFHTWLHCEGLQLIMSLMYLAPRRRPLGVAVINEVAMIMGRRGHSPRFEVR